VPATLRVAILLTAMVAVLHRGVRLSVVMALGSVGLAALFSFPVQELAGSVRFVLVDPDSLSLLFVVAVVLVLATTLETSGRLTHGLEHLSRALGSRRLTLASTPMLIGLLPMPGGAAFSAPPVGVASKGLGLSSERKVLVNYLFRHVWQYCWPLCPGLLIAASLADIPVGKIAVGQIPMSVAAILGAWFVLLWGVRDESSVRSPGALARFASALAPVALGIAAGFLLERWASPPLPEKAGLGIGLLGAVLWLWLADASKGSPVTVVSHSKLPHMLGMVASVLLFQQVLQESGCLELIARELSSVGVPLVLLAPALSLVTGLVAGIEIAFAGTALPLVLGVAKQSGIGDPLPLMALVFAGGMVGVMLSPLHLCLILTREYFGASMGRLYGRLVGALLPILAAGTLLYIVRT
jgi:integral membrane protein (TIGR00529 family)